MVEILELDDDYGIFDWPDAVKVYHHGDYSMAIRRYTYGSKSEADLETENAKLREERDTYRDLVGCMVHPDIPDLLYAENVKLREQGERLFGKVLELGTENEKLRELAHAMTYCTTGRCLECPMCSPFDTSIGGTPECRASWKLRELGIEEDDE